MTNINIPTSNKTQISAEIKQAVRDQDGNQHYLVESSNGEVWISLSELRSDENTVFDRLQRIGTTILTTAPKNAFKKMIEAVSDFQDALVATQPGFVSPKIYVHPNGDVTHADSCRITPIVSFTVDVRYDTKGSMKDWKTGLSAVIEGNAICSFLLAYGFLPFLLKLSPLKHNPTVELISPPEYGKSGACAIAASIYGGDPESDNGLGASWNMTTNAYSKLRRMANDSLFYVDESNMQGEELKHDGLIAFMQASTADKARHTDGAVIAKPVWTALLSNGNELPEHRFTGASDTIKAAESRRITIVLDEPVFSKSDWKRLRDHVDTNYGLASRRFAKKVVNSCAENELEFKHRIRKLMSEFSSQVGDDDTASQRIQDVFALTYAAGALAREWKILPSKCMNPADAVEQIHSKTMSKVNRQKPQSAEQRIREILAFHKTFNRKCASTDRPKKTPANNDIFSYYLRRRNGGITVYCHARKLRAALGTDHRSVLRELREKKILVGENGNSPKLTSQAPTYVGFKGRVYKLVLPARKLVHKA